MFTTKATAGVARTGSLSLHSKPPISTPHWFALSSRGVIPHLTPTLLSTETSTGGIYLAYEDFIEKPTPPILASPGGIRRFTSLPDEVILLLGARRSPPVAAPAANSNTDTRVSVSTSVGFRALEAEAYIRATPILTPDLAVALEDIPYSRPLGRKRLDKAISRQTVWLRAHVAAKQPLIAPVLPVPCGDQLPYLDSIAEHPNIVGLAIYNETSLRDIPQKLAHLPRVGLTAPRTPHELLTQIAAGMDICTLPFVNEATDAGIALTFHLPALTEQGQRPLGLDLWLSTYETDTAALVEGCDCYACRNHHRAYIRHLLNAREMLAWTLLQMHNHRVVDGFFEGVRDAIASGELEGRRERLKEVYEGSMPEITGQGPRRRGYQFKSEGPGEEKKNSSPWMGL
ncbi:tRNA-guanine transglycosylase [Piedraia hortae CBS 480.64]|uniref:Queuine tRNA-ribosyltransferase accessory subunit 2 n=1 Tax=Piedraia hortae CBS 480.64 TaxID=1314780 RepID=A0A6A7BTC5_9PEZI|nr:tRNA-guanine transglycosylase [Piedraia hortae CBS 480.64]